MYAVTVMESKELADGLATEQINRRATPRHGVDEDARLLLVVHGSTVSCRVVDLSLGGCRLRTKDRFTAGSHVRVEVTFKVRGLAFRFCGVTQWTDGRHLLGIRFVDVPARRREELVEALAEVEAENAANAAQQAAVNQTGKEAVACQPLLAQDTPPVRIKPARNERRESLRHDVDTSAAIILVKIASRLCGRILDLSRTGCRIRTEQRFPVGIYTRVEAEFHLEGLPFRLGGVIQAIHDRNTVGIRFLDMSSRKRDYLARLIEDMRELREQGSPDREELGA